jgi:cytidylate kinase
MAERVQETIQALVKALHAGAPAKEAGEARPTVALSRSHGAGGRQIAEALAERLGIHLYDKSILEAVAKQAGVSRQAMESLDDRLGQRRMEWLYTLLTGENATLDAYRHHLVNMLLTIERQGGIILGRGAHAVLASHRVFRLRITGTERMCAQRVAERDALDRETALQKVRAVDKARAEFLRAMFNRPVDIPEFFDLAVNTDRFTDLNDVVELVLKAMAAQGYAVTRQSGQ